MSETETESHETQPGDDLRPLADRILAGIRAGMPWSDICAEVIYPDSAYRRLFTIAAWRCVGPLRAEQLADEAWSVFLEEIVQFERFREVTPSGWTGYLHRWMRSAVFDIGRRRELEARNTEDLPNSVLADTIPDGDGDQLATRDRQELIQAVWSAVLSFPEQAQRILRYRYHDGLRLREIAARESTSIVNIHRHVSRYLAKIKDHLRDQGFV